MKLRQLTGAGISAFVLTAALTILPAVSAAAVTCRVLTPTSAGYEGGRVSTTTLTVPNSSVSGCKDINVRNIKDTANAADNCATFTVVMFPSNGSEPYYSKSKFACSKGANGPVVPIATNVLNGTKYRVLYNVETSHLQRHTFQVVD